MISKKFQEFIKKLEYTFYFVFFLHLFEPKHRHWPHLMLKMLGFYVVLNKKQWNVPIYLGLSRYSVSILGIGLHAVFLKSSLSLPSLLPFSFFLPISPHSLPLFFLNTRPRGRVPPAPLATSVRSYLCALFMRSNLCALCNALLFMRT